MRNFLLAASAVACAPMGTFASATAQARVVTFHCIITTYERGRPVQRILSDLKIDYDSQTINDRPVAMSNKEKMVTWKYTNIEIGGVGSGSFDKVTRHYSSTDIRPHGIRFQHNGICKSCDVLPKLRRITRRMLKAFYKC
jgi:hypothetical protein